MAGPNQGMSKGPELSYCHRGTRTEQEVVLTDIRSNGERASANSGKWTHRRAGRTHRTIVSAEIGNQADEGKYFSFGGCVPSVQVGAASGIKVGAHVGITAEHVEGWQLRRTQASKCEHRKQHCRRSEHDKSDLHSMHKDHKVWKC